MGAKRLFGLRFRPVWYVRLARNASTSRNKTKMMKINLKFWYFSVVWSGNTLPQRSPSCAWAQNTNQQIVATHQISFSFVRQTIVIVERTRRWSVYHRRRNYKHSSLRTAEKWFGRSIGPLLAIMCAAVCAKVRRVQITFHLECSGSLPIAVLYEAIKTLPATATHTYTQATSERNWLLYFAAASAAPATCSE